MSDRIRVPGYTQKKNYGNGIEIRNFSPSLVGTQFTDNTGTPLFTLGNFNITTNTTPKKDKFFTTNKFSKNLKFDNSDQKTSIYQLNATLKLDPKKLTNYALFAPLTEVVRVELEQIIIRWPASLHINARYDTAPYSGKTIEDLTYDSITNTTTFSVNKQVINNDFNINLYNNVITSTEFTDNTNKDFVRLYKNYRIILSGNSYNVNNYDTSITDYLIFTVDGQLIADNEYISYHIAPQKKYLDKFFNDLSDFGKHLLNSKTTPIYTADFDIIVKTNSGGIVYTNNLVTWPITDGYNIDFNTDDYVEYANKLLKICQDSDETQTNLITRFLVSESITNFDTANTDSITLEGDTSEQRANKIFTLYGLQFDKLNKYILGIKFANTVSYDGNNNMPDVYLKDLAKTLGWDTSAFNLLNDTTSNNELWKRIILNTPWIWKSKGTRKSIEFLLKFIGVPNGLINFTEHIYRSNNTLDLNTLNSVLKDNNQIENLDNYSVDSEGYPKPQADKPELYFQSDGGWYRETGGDNASIDITTGNNPHIGKYDTGNKYLNQFRNIIPDFKPTILSSVTQTTTQQNLFTNYKLGTFDDNTDSLYVDVVSDDYMDFSKCFVVTNTIVEKENASNICIVEGNNVLNVKINKKINDNSCKSDSYDALVVEPFNYINYYLELNKVDGTIYTNPEPTKFLNKNCCNTNGNESFLFNEVINKPDGSYELVNTGYICCKSVNKCGCLVTCKWTIPEEGIITINGEKYVVFQTEMGENRVVSKNGCNCPQAYTTPTQVLDPYTQEIGVGCKLTTWGYERFTELIYLFINRANSNYTNCG